MPFTDVAVGLAGCYASDKATPLTYQLRQYLIRHHRLGQVVAVIRKPTKRHRSRLLDAAKQDERHTKLVMYAQASRHLFHGKNPMLPRLPGHVVQQQRPQQCHDTCLLKGIDILQAIICTVRGAADAHVPVTTVFKLA